MNDVTTVAAGFQHELLRQGVDEYRQVNEEQQKFEELLFNLLPAFVAKEILAQGTCLPQSFPDVSVCFVDIANFTAMATHLTPQQLIAELNELFSAFDQIAEMNRCERLKINGDAYLFVAGLADGNTHHVRDAAHAALAMIAFVLDRNRVASQTWQIRIGLHVGPIVGGMIGIKRYLYEIFGDTANMAARLVAISEPMRIHVSSEVHDRLKQDFLFSQSADIELKGKGIQSTCFLEGARFVGIVPQ
jgi:adenylate cyclase